NMVPTQPACQEGHVLRKLQYIQYYCNFSIESPRRRKTNASKYLLENPAIFYLNLKVTKRIGGKFKGAKFKGTSCSYNPASTIKDSHILWTIVANVMTIIR